MRLRNSRGSITIEAAIIVPIFICVIMSINLLIRVVYIHGLMQHALNETAQEISTYSYIYSVSGLQNLHDSAQDEINKNKAFFDEYLSQTTNTYATINTLVGEANETIATVTSGDVLKVKEKLESLKGSANATREEIQEVTELLYDIGENPQKALISLAYYIGDGSFEAFKTKFISEPLTKTFARKYLAEAPMDAHRRLLSLNVVDGFNGLDFSQSTLFEDNQTVDIVVRYKIKNIMPIKIIPDISLIQRSVVRAWLDGEADVLSSDDNPNNSSENVWDLPPIKRGVKIQQIFGRNLPGSFPVITKFEQGTAEMVKSIDLDGITYQKPNNVKSKVNSYINELVEFKGAKYQEIQVLQKDIKKRKLVIVVPEGTISSEIQKVFDECIKNAGEDIQLEIKEFGKKSDKKDEGE